MAKEFYGFFDSTVEDEREYVADEMAAAFRAMGGTGVGRGLEVAAAGGMHVQVAEGHALIDGYVYALTDDGGGVKTLTLATSGSAPREDRVVLRLDLTPEKRSITMHVKAGVPSAAPVPPELTRNEDVREISLCRVRVNAAALEVRAEDIVDERLDAEVCGLPVPGVLQRGELDKRYLTPATEERTGAMSGEDKAALDDVVTLRRAMVDEGTVDLGGRWLVNAVLPYKETTLPDAVEQAEENIRYHAPVSFTATLQVEDWSETAPYMQTVSVPGVRGSDTPFVDVVLSDDRESAVLEMEAYGYVGRVDALDNAITAFCYEDKPEVEMTIQLRVVR